MFKNFLRKSTVSNNTLSNLNDIKKIQDNIKERDDNKSNKLEETFLTGVIHLKEYLNTKNEFNLKRAIDYFTKTTIIKKNFAGSYYYLSFIAYMAGDFELAKKYFHFTLVLDKNYPNLEILRQKVYSK